MPDPQLPDIPSFAGYLAPRLDGSSAPSDIPFAGYLAPRFDKPPLPPPVPATGTGNLFTSALMSSLHEARAEGARALQAGATLAGATDTAQQLSDYADQAHATAQSYANPEYENAPWYSPTGLAYRLTQMVPTTAAALGAGALATIGAPETAAGVAALTGVRALLGSAARRAALGGAAAMYLPAAGENVQRQISETGELTQPGKALALGVPEAALQGILPAKIGNLSGFARPLERLLAPLGKGTLGAIGKEAAGGVVAQSIAAGGTEAMTQLMGDPNRGFADRASDITRQALSGGLLGGLAGGAFGGMHALVGKPAGDMTNADMDAATKQALQPKQLTYQPVTTGWAPLRDVPDGELAGHIDTMQRNPPQTSAGVEELRQMLQEQQRRSAEAQARYAEAQQAQQGAAQRLLPPPSIQEGPPLQDMPAAELWTRFTNVISHLANNPQDPTARRAAELLRAEVLRRVAATSPVPAPEAPAAAPMPVPEAPPAAPVPAAPAPAAPVAPEPSVPWQQQEAVPPPTSLDNIRAGIEIERRNETRAANEPKVAALHANNRAYYESLLQRAAPETPREEPTDLRPGGPPAVVGAPEGLVAPVAPVAAPVIDFTKGKVTEGKALYNAASPDVQATLRQPLVDQIIARGDKEPTALQKKWGSALDILTSDGKLKPELRPTEVPAAPTETAPAPAPAAPTRKIVRDPVTGKFTLQGTPETRIKDAVDQISAKLAEQEKATPAANDDEATQRALQAMKEFAATPEAQEPPTPAAPPPVGAMTVKQLKDHITNVLGDVPKGKTKADLVQQIMQRRLQDARFANKIAPTGAVDHEGDLLRTLGKPEFGEVFNRLKSDPNISREQLVGIADRFNGPVAPSTSRAKALAQINSRQRKLMEFVPGEPTSQVSQNVTPEVRPKTVVDQSDLEGIPAFLDRRAPKTDTPVTTAADRTVALSDTAKQVGTLPDSPQKAQLSAEVDQLTSQLRGADRNPGYAAVVNKKVMELRSTVEKLAQPPADQVAPPGLTPSPRAEAVPAPAGDLDDRIGAAQYALGKLRKVLGPNAAAMLDQHQAWLKAVNQAGVPDEYRAALAKDPEADPEADTLSDIKRPPEALVDYLNAQERVLQELRALSGPESRARVVSSRDGLPVTQLDADVTDMHQRGVTPTDIANHIIENSASPEKAELMARLKPFIPKNAKTIFRDGVTDKEGEYFPGTKTSALYSAPNATQTFIHEMVHAATHQALEGDSGAAQAIRSVYNQIRYKRDYVAHELGASEYNDYYGLKDAHEMVAEAYSNPTFRDFLRSQFVKGTSLWDRFVDGVRRFIGLPSRLFNAFDRIMSLGDDLMKEQQTYPNDAWVGPNSYARRADDGMKAVANGADLNLGSLMRAARLNFGAVAGKYGLGWATDYRIAQLQGDKIKSMPAFVEATGPRLQARGQAIGFQGETAERLSNELPKEERDLLARVMYRATSHGVDPQRPLEAQPKIHDDPDRVNRLAEVTNEYNQLSPEGKRAYEAQRATTSSQFLMTLVDDMQQTARALPGGLRVDRFEDYGNRVDLHARPDKVEAYWKQAFANAQAELIARGKQLSADRARIDAAIAAEPPPDNVKELTGQSNVLKDHVAAVNNTLKDVVAKRDIAAEAPHFHLGRDGDYFGLFKFVTKPGAIDPEAEPGTAPKLVVDRDKLDQFADRLNKSGFDDAVINEGGQHGTGYIRVGSAGQLDALTRVITQAQADGLLSSEGAARGEVTDPHVFNAIASPAMMRRVVEQMRAFRQEAPEGSTPETVAILNKAFSNQEQNLRRILLNTMQENSMGRLMSQRRNVPGFSKDMIGQAANTSKIMARSIARSTLAPETGALQARMQDELTALKQLRQDPNANVSLDDLLGASRAVSELMIREGNKQTSVPPTPVDALRRISHTFSVGASPTYPLTLMSQNLTTTFPELLKTHNPVQAMRAIFGASPDAIKLLTAIFKSPDWAMAGATYDAIENSGLSPQRQAQAKAMIARGDLGQVYSTEMTEHSPLEFGHSSTVMKMANAMGFYSEQLPRIIAGFAAHDLYNSGKRPTSVNYKDMTPEQYASHVMSETQGVWGAGSPRQLSRSSPLFGPAAPLFNQFMNWSAQITGKMYQELRDSIKGDADTKSEARRWLLGHAAATTMLAGTLGLPALSVMATVYDKLMDWVTNRDDHDLTASYRSFLSDTFGKDTGEVIARGLPRAAGMDFAHWGEATTIPGSATVNFLFEKRKLEDAWRDWAKSMTGPGISHVFKLVEGLRDMSNGDYLNGLIRMSPELLGAPLEAYRLDQRGFVSNLTGQKLPIAGPGAADIIMTMLGIDPAKEAEYNEVSRDAAGMRTMRELNSSNIVRHMEMAYMRGDEGMMNAWQAESQRWQMQHPALMPPAASFQRELKNHMRQSAISQGIGLPVGVQPQDIAAQRALRYGNIQRPQ